MQSGNFTAEFGRTGGGVVNLVFKSGTNQLHGTLYEFLRNSAFDANNFFNNRFGRRKARNVLNQFGATAGGPLIKDRTEGAASPPQVGESCVWPLISSFLSEFVQVAGEELVGDRYERLIPTVVTALVAADQKNRGSQRIEGVECTERLSIAP